MTVVETASGEKIATDLPADKVADLQAPKAPEPAAEPAAPAAPVKDPQPSQKPADPAQPSGDDSQKPADQQSQDQPNRDDKGHFKPKKAGPIANLLSKLNDERVAREAAEKRATDAEAKLNQPSQPAAPTVTKEAADEIAELAKKHGIEDPSLIKDIIETARKGLVNTNPAIPKEVQDLLAERQQEKAVAAETAAFNIRVGKLSGVFKDEPIAQHKDKLMELAYSTDKAPDGERYCDKELSELYFGYIKPTIEPGKVSAEPSRGGSKAGGKVTDFAEIHGDDAKLDEFATTATKEQWSAYTKWRDGVQGDVPIKHK